MAMAQTIKEGDRPYLAGAMPEVDGNIVYSLDVNLPGKQADEVYNKVLSQLELLTKDENQTGISKIAIENKEESTIVATYEEWLVFSNKVLQLDRSKMTYIIVAKCYDGSCHLDILRINYKYDLERKPQYFSAEETIADKKILSKDGTKLKKGYIKFRKKTVDRMNELVATLREGIEEK